MRIQINNLKDGQTVAYSLPLLIGEVIDGDVNNSITAVNTSSVSKEKISWPVCDGHFKLLVEVQRGHNTIHLECNETLLSFTINYHVLPITRFVRPVYVVCSNDPTPLFQGPPDEDRSVRSACLRIHLGCRLLQTVVAETMAQRQFTRKTFVLENDVMETSPPCHIFRCALTKEQALAMSDNQLWRSIGQQLMTCDHFAEKDLCKWFCFMSFTTYQLPTDVATPKAHAEVLAHTKGHAALGGGGLALFGTGNLHCWAEHVGDIQRRFTDTRKIDRRKFMDDSAYRGFHWANYATSLGASLHELGHTFDLAHTHSGFMARGFDDIHRVLTLSSTRGRIEAELRHSFSPKSTHQQQTKFSFSPRASPVRKIASPAPVMHLEQEFERLSMPLSVVYSETEPSQSVQDAEDGRRKRSREGSVETGEWPDKMADDSESAFSGSRPAVAVCATPEPCHLTSDISSRCQSDVSSVESHGTAGWQRCSAVLLNYHKWFNVPSDHECCSSAISIDKCTVRSTCGLRIVELRTIHDSIVSQHWEFVQRATPTQLNLSPDVLARLRFQAADYHLLAEDSCGNVLKRSVRLNTSMELQIL